MPGKLSVVQEAAPLSIRLCADGAIEVDQVPQPDDATFLETLAKIARLHPELDVQLFADDPCDYEGIGKIIYASQRAGLNGGAFTFTSGRHTPHTV
jgi:biopolymer transport protein ExbD